MRASCFVVVAAAALISAVSPARAAVITPIPAASATNGIVLGADGNLWVAEQFNNSVARISPSGALIKRYQLTGQPTTIATGPGGTVWVAVTDDQKLVRIDATASEPGGATYPVGATGCGPVALVSGGDGRMYFSLPSDGVCNGGVSTLSSISASGGPISAPVTSPGSVFSLAVAGGKLFAPDYDNGVIRRLSLGGGFAVEATLSAPAGSNPDGIAADASGTLWVTGQGNGTVLRFSRTQSSGPVTAITPTGGVLQNPAGVVASADGSVYIAGKASGNLLRVSADGTQFKFFPTPGAAPFAITDGPSGDLFYTDQNQTQIARFVNGAPRTNSTEGSAPTSTTITAAATIDPRGNETLVVFEIGTTTSYGQTSTPSTIPIGLAPVTVATTFTNLAPATTYHLRARSSNAEGVVLGPDITVITPPAAVNQVPSGPVSLPPPSITAASLSPSTFAVAKGKKGGSKLKVTLNTAATVDAVVSLEAKGVRKTKKKVVSCVTPPHKKVKGQKPCIRLIKKGTLHLGALNAGPTTVAFTGKLGRKSLAPGKYTLTLTIGAAARSITFTIKR